MPIQTTYEESQLYVTIDSSIAFDVLRDYLRDAALDEHFDNVQSIIVDARTLKSQCDSIELYELACYVAGLDTNRQRRIALVVRDLSATHRQADFLQYCAQHRGAHVRVFTDLTLASDWALDISTISAWLQG